MKTKALLLLFAILAFYSCSKDYENVDNSPMPKPTEPTTVKFNLTASHPDDGAQTRAVKKNWENGDAIFVFFNNVGAPKHLKMTYNGTAWTSAEYDGTTQIAGVLGLKNGDSGTMRAVYLPFGSNATVSASGSGFTFSTTYYAYYATATLSYTVENNEVSGAFDMTIPANYVQFFVEDAAASDGGYTLGIDAVTPVGLASIAADGTITETSDKTTVDDMTGYAYSGGYLFSGKLANWSYGSNYYFSKTKTADGSRADYFVTGKTLASHDAIKLPANNNSKWQTVGRDISVNMKKGETDLGTWHTCNYNQLVPEEKGDTYTQSEAMILTTLPTGGEINNLFANCTLTKLTCHGQVGMVLKSDTGFLFIPRTTNSDNEDTHYWTSDIYNNKGVLIYIVFSNNYYRTLAVNGTPSIWVRPIQRTPAATNLSEDITSTAISKVLCTDGNIYASLRSTACLAPCDPGTM